MAPLNVNLSTNMITTIDQHTLNVSRMKYGDETTQRYPFKWISLAHEETGSFFSGIQMLLIDESMKLPIVYDNGNGSLLIRLTKQNTSFAAALVHLEETIRAALPEEEKDLLQSFTKMPDNASYDPAVVLKSRYAAIDQGKSSGVLAKGNTIDKCVLMLQKLHYFQGKIYPSLVLKACTIREGIDPHFQMGGSGCNDAPCTDEDYFNMLNQNTTVVA